METITKEKIEIRFMKIREKDYKEETFTAWFELIALIEYLALTKEEFKEILTILREKYISQKKLQDVKIHIYIKDEEIFDTDNTYAEVIHKWLESIVYAFKFLQYARSRGGTYSHKVGTIWMFLNKNYKTYEEFLHDKSKNYYNETN